MSTQTQTSGIFRRWFQFALQRFARSQACLAEAIPEIKKGFERGKSMEIEMPRREVSPKQITFGPHHTWPDHAWLMIIGCWLCHPYVLIHCVDIWYWWHWPLAGRKYGTGGQQVEGPRLRSGKPSAKSACTASSASVAANITEERVHVVYQVHRWRNNQGFAVFWTATPASAYQRDSRRALHAGQRFWALLYTFYLFACVWIVGFMLYTDMFLSVIYYMRKTRWPSLQLLNFEWLTRHCQGTFGIDGDSDVALSG